MTAILRRFGLLLLLFTSIVASSGCMVIADGKEHGEMPRATLGAELIDLKKAHEAGVLSDAEYREQRAKLLGDR